MMVGRSFIHGDDAEPRTLSEIKRIHDLVAPSDFLGVYAYATQSGFAAFSLDMGGQFWAQTPTKWLFGLDYGRTQPQAIRSILEREDASVRIHDGEWIVDQVGFLPRRDFHAKLSIMLNPAAGRFGMVVGSGNFSSNGLRNSIEAGSAFYTDQDDDYNFNIAPSVQIANQLWEAATPAHLVLDAYEAQWLDSFSRRGAAQDEEIEEITGNEDIFWIEAGYVTRNRGHSKPGNQIDFPRGMSRYFGFNPPDDLPVKSIIGALTLHSEVGDPITRNLRLGNNHMEKISLPTPEAHGFDIYDGKVLVFERMADSFAMSALEVADFESAFGDRLSAVRTMASGRRYGHIV